MEHIYYRRTINETIKAKYPLEIYPVQNTAQKSKTPEGLAVQKPYAS